MNWLGKALDLLAFWIVPIAASLVLLFPLRTRWPEAWQSTLWRRYRLPFFVVTRVLSAILLYCGLGYYGSSDYDYWVHHNALPILDGELPGRDFINGYAPLFPYLQAMGMWVLGHPVGVLLPFLIGDCICVFVGPRLAREVLGRKSEPWIGAWMSVSPLLWHEVVLFGQDEPLFLGMLIASAFLVVRRHQFLGMVVLGVGLCATKVTFAPYALAVLLAVKGGLAQRVQAWLAFTATCGLIYGAYVLTGASPLPQTALSTRFVLAGHGISLYDVGDRLGLQLDPVIGLLVYLGCTLGLVFWASSRMRDDPMPIAVVSGVSLVHSVTMLILPFALFPYVCQGFLFCLITLGQMRPSVLKTTGLILMPAIGLLVALLWREPHMQTPLTVGSIAVHVMILGFLFQRFMLPRSTTEVLAPPQRLITPTEGVSGEA